MPRSYQAYPHNAVITHSPQNTMGGDTGKAIEDAKETFKLPGLFDICQPVTQSSQNPFLAGLNEMGAGANTSGVPGQTGNMLSGFQSFLNILCGFAMGGSSMGEVISAARKLQADGGDLHESLEAVRKLRATIGTGTSPQTVLDGAQNISDTVHSTPFASGIVAMGGDSGNQVVDGIVGGQNFIGSLCGIATGSTDVSDTTPSTVVNATQGLMNAGGSLITGTIQTAITGPGMLDAASSALNVNNANHAGHTSLTTAQSVSLKEQNLLVSQDFSSVFTVAAQDHWSWDENEGQLRPGSAKVVCDGGQDPMVSSEIPVVAGETLAVACTVKWSGLSYTGTGPIVLAIEKYRKTRPPNGAPGTVYSDIGWYNVANIASPASASTQWVDIAGTYVVEPGVDQVRFRFDPKGTISAGTIWWDEAVCLKTDLIADECVPGVGMTVDDIVRQLYGADGDAFTHNESAVALGNTASALTSVSARLAALEAEGHTGAIAGDDFNWTGEILASPNWGGLYSAYNIFGAPSAYYTADGIDAVWAINNKGNDQNCFFDWQGTDNISTTDYQLIQLVLDSVPQSDTDLFGGIYKAYTCLFGRISSDWTKYVMAAIGSAGDYFIGYRNGGSFITMNSGTCAVPGLGSVASFYCGDKTTTTTRHYKLQVGSVTIADFNEVGTGSALGASTRKWGWGAQAQGGAFNSLGTPPKMNQWLALDQ
jgi:hypothetical protein